MRRKTSSPSISASVLRTSEKPQTSQVGQQSTGQVTASCPWVCSEKCIQQRSVNDHLVSIQAGDQSPLGPASSVSLTESSGRGGYPDL